MKKSFASALYSIANLSAPVSYRARIASFSSASAFAIASSPVTTVMFRMLSMFIFIFLQYNPPTGTSGTDREFAKSIEGAPAAPLPAEVTSADAVSGTRK